jgi:hypothetical protein
MNGLMNKSRGLREVVDLEKSWTVKSRGPREVVDYEKSWTVRSRGL